MLITPAFSEIKLATLATDWEEDVAEDDDSSVTFADVDIVDDVVWFGPGDTFAGVRGDDGPSGAGFGVVCEVELLPKGPESCCA
jgi:hypothetical protein